MSDEWIDRNESTLVNFLLYRSNETMFMQSFDAFFND